jgi:hypothetical protein
LLLGSELAAQFGLHIPNLPRPNPFESAFLMILENELLFAFCV